MFLRTWGSLLEDCRARLEYLRQALEIETMREAGVRHMQDKYADSMPDVITRISTNRRVKHASILRTRGKKRTTKKRAAKGREAAKTRAKRPAAS